MRLAVRGRLCQLGNTRHIVARTLLYHLHLRDIAVHSVLYEQYLPAVSRYSVAEVADIGYFHLHSARWGVLFLLLLHLTVLPLIAYSLYYSRLHVLRQCRQPMYSVVLSEYSEPANAPSMRRFCRTRLTRSIFCATMWKCKINRKLKMPLCRRQTAAPERKCRPNEARHGRRRRYFEEKRRAHERGKARRRTRRKARKKEYREHTEKDGGGQVRYCRKCGKKAEEKIFGG